MCKLNILDKLSLILIFIGAINWGTIGLFKINLINVLLLDNLEMERITYIIIFLGALDLILLFFRSNLSTTDK